MKRILALVLALVAVLSIPGVALSVDKPSFSKDSTVELTGVIQGMGAIEVANRIVAVSETQDVNIVINSPGGQVTVGQFILNAIDLAHGRGRTVSCYVTGMAASMAFQVYAYCDKRYALKHSLLLWHPVKAVAGNQPLRSQDAQDLADDLKRVERHLTEELIARLHIPRSVFFYHYQHETLFLATELNELAPGFMQTVDYIPGVKDLTPLSKQNMFDFYSSHEGEIVFIGDVAQ
jgi:ATP-dependent protease ClpP protease subunit